MNVAICVFIRNFFFVCEIRSLFAIKVFVIQMYTYILIYNNVITYIERKRESEREIYIDYTYCVSNTLGLFLGIPWA